MIYGGLYESSLLNNLSEKRGRLNVLNGNARFTRWHQPTRREWEYSGALVPVSLFLFSKKLNGVA